MVFGGVSVPKMPGREKRTVRRSESADVKRDKAELSKQQERIAQLDFAIKNSNSEVATQLAQEKAKAEKKIAQLREQIFGVDRAPQFAEAMKQVVNEGLLLGYSPDESGYKQFKSRLDILGKQINELDELVSSIEAVNVGFFGKIKLSLNSEYKKYKQRLADLTPEYENAISANQVLEDRIERLTAVSKDTEPEPPKDAERVPSNENTLALFDFDMAELADFMEEGEFSGAVFSANVANWLGKNNLESVVSGLDEDLVKYIAENENTVGDIKDLSGLSLETWDEFIDAVIDRAEDLDDVELTEVVEEDEDYEEGADEDLKKAA
jgi:flavin-binding protein dodecin